MVARDTTSRTASALPRSNPWASGLSTFAGVIMITLGVFQALEGLAALFTNEIYVATPNFVFQVDVSAWGWIHLLLGVLVAVSGFFVLQGAVWARSVGIGLAVLSALANFLFIPYYPIWSLLIIALDVAVIWALTVHDAKTG